MEKLGVLVIRGSGSTGFDRQKKFISKVNQRLEKRGINTQKIIYEYIDWYGPLENQQILLLDRMLDHPQLRLKSTLLRKFLITNITDLINYGGKANMPDGAYKETHEKVHEAVIRLQENLPKNSPLVIVASSMGTEIINNYIWDRQKAKTDDSFGKTAFERFETLVGLFTFGNNIPIFSTSNKIDELCPIQFPDPEMDTNLKKLAIWENYYDKNDPLGYPIKFINKNYKNANVTDIQIGVGNLLSFWNILSHFGYWTSKKLQNRLSDFIEMLFKEI